MRKQGNLVSVRQGAKAFAGKDDTEKWLNWFLTKQFIAGIGKVPPDECLPEARRIIAHLKKEAQHERT